MTPDLHALTSPQAAATAGRPLVVPLGATEQHGPHLPVGTDTDVARALCRGLTAHAQVVLAPALPYGSSGEHAGFPGVLSIGQAALEAVVVELARSATATWSRVLFVSGHGGNAEPLNRAVRLLRSESRDVRAWAPRSGIRDAHAGHTETSIQLALHPGRVGVAQPGRTEPVAALIDDLRAGGVKIVSPNGVLGDPTDATAADGRELLARWTAELVGYVQDWMRS